MRLLQHLCALVLLSLVHAFKMPTLENIGDIFKHLVQAKSDARVERETLTEDIHGDRTKRQSSSFQDGTQAPSQTLPRNAKKEIDFRLMPVLANGHIGVTVFDDGLYLNGLYSGTGGQSHRAKIPAIVMSRISLGSTEQEQYTNRDYNFDVKQGIFTETIDSEIGTVTHRLYAHAKYVRVLVSDIYAQRDRGGVFFVNYPKLNDTADIQFDQKQLYNYADWKISGKVKVPEAGGAKQETVSMYWMEPLTQIPLNTRNTWHEVSLLAVDKESADAQSDFTAAKNVILSKGPDGLRKEHTDTWNKIWSHGKLEVETRESALAKAVEFSQYYILSSLSPVYPANPLKRTEVLYGAARGSLGKGHQGKDYQGHVFWDNEMYIMPAVLLFHPELVKKQLRYRSFVSDAARLNAEEHGDLGMRFPWESAFSGREATPDGTCEGCAERQIHVTGAVGWAIRQYYSATRDRDFMTNPYYQSCDMSREIARFFFNRAKYNTSIGRYDIRDVMGPDDYHDHVDNNAYTNAAASLAIHWARYYACVCDLSERDEVPDEWIQTALYLELPFSNVERVHHQHEGFNSKGTNLTNKQADTIMMTYPLNWNMSTDIMKNDLERYELITDPNSPGMTWSWFAIGFKWVDNDQKMYSYFTKSYANYMDTHFYVWTEYPQKIGGDIEGAVNYLPGMGGFLQSIIYGFAGIRIRPEALEFHNPQPPPRCSKVTLRQLKYLGASLTITITETTAEIRVHSIGEYPLILRYNDTSSREESLTTGAVAIIEPAKQGFYIFSTNIVSCDHPRDYIYMPWGYSPWISGCSITLPSLFLLVSAASIAVLQQQRTS